MNETKETLLSKIAGLVSKDLAAMLKKEIKLEQAKLVDGTVVEIDDNQIFVVTEEGENLPAPVGEHELESGEIVVVQEEGIIAEIKSKEMEGEPEKEMDLSAEVEQLKKDVAELKSYMKPKEEEMAKEEPKQEAELAKEEPKEEIKEEPKKEELSEVKKVTHSPEKEVKKVKQNFSANKHMTTKQRVMARIANK